jgi:hypothetical protein
MEITENVATRVLEVVDAGLSKGLGHSIIGNMCVEAAVCFALDLPHGDFPECVHDNVRRFKIAINDAANVWFSHKDRANGLRRLAIAQLGSNIFKAGVFNKRVSMWMDEHILPAALLLAKEKLKSVYYCVSLNALDVCIKRPRKKSFEAYANIPHMIPYRHFCTYWFSVGVYFGGPCCRLQALQDMGIEPEQRREWILALCEAAVQILVDMKSPGTQFLHLTENGKTQ